MALTKAQADSVIRLFILSFASENDNQKRKKLFIEFEDIFGKGIKNWQVICREKLEQGIDNQIIKEHFEKLIYRNEKKSVSNSYTIRKLEKSDFEEVRMMINSAFDFVLTFYDDYKIEKFMESGYSFVACHNDEILGVILGYLVPDLNLDVIYIDTLVVAESARGSGIGKKLLAQVSKQAQFDKVHILRLQTEKNSDAYQIYKHLGFCETKLVQMKKYYT